MNPITTQRNAQAETRRILDHLQSGRLDAAARRPIGHTLEPHGHSGFHWSSAWTLGFLGRLITRVDGGLRKRAPGKRTEVEAGQGDVGAGPALKPLQSPRAR